MLITRHAARRMSQRGIGARCVEFTLRWGHRYHRTGIEFHVLGRRDLARAAVRDPEVLKWEGTTVLSQDGVVISVYKNRDFSHIRRKAVRDLRPCHRRDCTNLFRLVKILRRDYGVTAAVHPDGTTGLSGRRDRGSVSRPGA